MIHLLLATSMTGIYEAWTICTLLTIPLPSINCNHQEHLSHRPSYSKNVPRPPLCQECIICHPDLFRNTFMVYRQLHPCSLWNREGCGGDREARWCTGLITHALGLQRDAILITIPPDLTDIPLNAASTTAPAVVIPAELDPDPALVAIFADIVPTSDLKTQPVRNPAPPLQRIVLERGVAIIVAVVQRHRPLMQEVGMAPIILLPSAALLHPIVIRRRGRRRSPLS